MHRKVENSMQLQRWGTQSHNHKVSLENAAVLVTTDYSVKCRKTPPFSQALSPVLGFGLIVTPHAWRVPIREEISYTVPHILECCSSRHHLEMEHTELLWR
jgi:hypothetical protein